MKNYVISVSLGTGCYRHIELTDHSTLAQLSDAILQAFDFENDHCHAFFMDNIYWGDNAYWSEKNEPGDPVTRSKKLCHLGLQKGSRFKYVFDFGDEWRFQCRLLRIVETDTPALPHVIRSVGEAPEQYGGYDEDELSDEDWDEDDEPSDED